MPKWLVSALAAASLIAASAGLKLWLQRYSTQIDVDRLNTDIIHRLKALNFATAIDPDGPATAVRAWRKDCRLIVRNGDRARELSVIFKREAVEYGPVIMGYRDVWAPHPPPARAIVERFAQNGAARIGINFGRPAVIALALSGSCKSVKEALNGLVAHASIKRSARDGE